MVTGNTKTFLSNNKTETDTSNSDRFHIHENKLDAQNICEFMKEGIF